MQDGDFNTVKSMEGLPTIGTSPKYRQGKKKKEDSPKKQKNKITEQPNESTENENTEISTDYHLHCIDYRA